MPAPGKKLGIDTTSSPFAVVIGVDCVTGLQTSRILAERGVAVVGIANDASHFCCQTKACHKIIEAETSSEALIATLETLGPDFEQKAALLPCADASVLQLATHRCRLEPWYKFVIAPQEVVEESVLKSTFYAKAAKEHWPIPSTRTLRNRIDAEAAAAALTYPCVIKPDLKTAA